MPDHDALIQDGKKRVLACALQGDAVQAQEMLDQLERLLATKETTNAAAAAAAATSTDELLLEYRDAVLDAWVAHQSKLLEEYHTETTTTTTTLNNHSQRKQQLRAQIFHAAQSAHNALERTVPFLSRPAMAIYTARSASSPRRLASPEEAEVLDDPGVGVLGSPSKQRTKQQQQQPLQQTPQVMLHKCNSVLTAWARASQVIPTRQGIPQRATFLLQRMEASARGSASAGVQPTTESYNRVLEAWAWSREHLRATMAEQIFQTMTKQSRKGNNNKRNNNKAVAKPNGESYRWIIHAWCHSQQRKSAFTATGHLMKFLRRLEKGHEDIEPTLDTYHMIMEAWTTAE